MAFEKKYKEGLVSDIVLEVNGSYDYKDFAADCVREVVSQWDDEQLAAWFGREEGTDCPVADSIDCYHGECEHTKTT